jgi:hypothetical protein
VLIEKDEQLKYKEQSYNMQKTERDFAEESGFSDSEEQEGEEAVVVRENKATVPDPFVFPIRVKPVDWTIAWQKKRAQFMLQIQSQSKVQDTNVMDEKQAAIASEDRTFMDLEQYKEIKRDEIIHQQNYTEQQNKIRAIQAEKKKL